MRIFLAELISIINKLGVILKSENQLEKRAVPIIK